MQLAIQPQINPWPAAVLLGSLLLWLVILLMPQLASRSAVLPNSVIEIDFMPWQPPVPRAPEKPTAPPVKAQPKPKPVVPPKPKVTPPPQPVLAEKIVEPKAEPLEQNEAAPVEPPPAITESAEADAEVLPVPVALAKLTSMPRFLHRERPDYPVAAKVAGIEATVKLAVLIDETGKVRKVEVIESAGPDFDRSAVAAMRVSSFEPARVNGKMVPVLLKMPVKYRLR